MVCPCRCQLQSAEHERRPAESTQTASKARHSTKTNNTAACFVQSTRSRAEGNRGDDLEVEGERVLPAQLEQQIRPPARILAPMEAFKKRIYRVRVPRREHNIACGAGSRLERRRHEQRPTASEIKAAYGSRQSCKTCNGADELAVRTLLCENCRCNDSSDLILLIIKNAHE